MDHIYTHDIRAVKQPSLHALSSTSSLKERANPQMIVGVGAELCW